MRDAGTSAKRGSLAALSTAARSCGLSAWGWCRPHRLRPAIAHQEGVAGLPALQGAQIDAGDLAGEVKPRAVVVRRVNCEGKNLAIFEANHSASPMLKIALTFFDSTSNAAVSASARSLRSNSRSSSLIRFRSCFV